MEKNKSFGLLCVSCMGVCQIVSVLFSLGGVRDLILLVSDYCRSLYFTTTELLYDKIFHKCKQPESYLSFQKKHFEKTLFRRKANMKTPFKTMEYI